MKIIYCGVMGGQNGFTKALKSVCDEFEDIKQSELINITSADLVILQTQDVGISEQAIKHIKSIGAYIIGWCGDARNHTPKHYVDYAKWGIDISAFSNMNDVRYMQSLGYRSCFLQIGVDHEIYYPSDCVKDIDIVFMGNHFGHFPLSGLRQEMIKELKRIYGDRFKAYGINQPDGSFMGNQNGEADIYRRAKIGINLSHYNYERYTSDRMFRMLGCGVCVLSQNYNGISHDFGGEHLFVWNDIPSLVKNIDYLLDNPELVKMVGDNGAKLAHSKHTFTHMANDFIKLYEQNK